MEEAGRLVQAQVLSEKEDIFYLTFDELHDVVRSHRVDDRLIRQRKEAFRSYEALTPPRVLTSDGEALTGAYRREDVPAGALAGLAVSTGTVEEGPASSWTWRTPTSERATSWSQGSPIPAGRRCSSVSRAW